jgi:heat shock protein HslJ
MEDYMTASMKKTIVIISFLFFIPAIFVGASGRSMDPSSTAFSELQNRKWLLAEVKNGPDVISIIRDGVPKEIYTLVIQTDRLVGSGGGNNFFASYTVGENYAISIGRIASTRMMPIFEMKEFTEYDYFLHLERADRWTLRNGKLELHTYDKNRAEIILIFVDESSEAATVLYRHG